MPQQQNPHKQPPLSPSSQSASQPGQTQSAPPQQVPAETSQTQHRNHDGAEPGGVSSPSSANQSTEGRKISCEDIQLVQNLIERCLQLYMNQAEVINTLLSQAKIEPGFTSLVWQKLEEQNPEFFKAYYMRLKLKKHILTFNQLLEQQVQLMQKMRIIPTKIPVQPLNNGMHHPSMGQVPMGYPVPQLPPASVPVLPHSPVLNSGANPLESFHTSHESPGPNAMESSLSLSPIMQCSGTGEMALGSGAGGSTPNFPFGSITDMGLANSISLDTSFVSHEPHSHHEHNPQNGIVPFGGSDEDGSNSRELGALGHLPRNFSLSDLAAELGASSDLEALGSYSSPFMSPEAESFLHSPDRHDIDTDKLLADLDFGDLK